MAYYEERRVIVRRGAFRDYRRFVHDSLWPALTDAGARPLVLLSGLIGAPAEETYLVTGFPDLESWQRCQYVLTGTSPDDGGVDSIGERRAALIEDERARLLIDSGVRPKEQTPTSDRRAVYGMRRFWIRPADWPSFIRQSAEGIWPRIEAQDACIFGLFRDAAVTEPMEALLLTGYHGPAHWQETRATSESFAQIPDSLRVPDEQARSDRNALTLRSYVCLMAAHWPD
jgi:hypothetical protein